MEELLLLEMETSNVFFILQLLIIIVSMSLPEFKIITKDKSEIVDDPKL